MGRSRGSLAPILALSIAVIVIVAVLALAAPMLPLPTGSFNIFGRPLTEEIRPPHTLYAAAMDLEPGQVYRIIVDQSGVHIQQTNHRLIERLQLRNVDIAVNDVIAPHLYDAYIDHGTVRFRGIRLQIAESQSFTLAVRYKILARPDGWSPVVSWPGPAGCPDIHFDRHLEWHHICVNGSRKPVYTRPIDSVLGTWQNEVLAYNARSCSLIWRVNNEQRQAHICGTIRSYADAAGTVVMGRGASYLKYMVSYAMIYNSVWGPEQIAQYDKHVVSSQGLQFFFDPTWFNGSEFIDILGRAASSANTVRIPAQYTWLWLIKGLASDNKLHLRFVPPGSTFVIKYNGMVYEWRVDCQPNAAGLCEDYPIDIASIFGATVLPNATVELVYPSEKVRFYVPEGLRIVIEGSGWSETYEVQNRSYVDLAIPGPGVYTVRVLGYEAEPRVSIETSGSVVNVVVADERGYAIPGAKVYVYDTAGNLVAAGTTNDLGAFQFEKSQLSGDQARIVVVALKSGTLYRLDKIVRLSSGTTTIEPTTTSTTSSVETLEHVETAMSPSIVVVLIILLMLGLGLAAALALTRGSKR